MSYFDDEEEQHRNFLMRMGESSTPNFLPTQDNEDSRHRDFLIELGGGRYEPEPVVPQEKGRSVAQVGKEFFSDWMRGGLNLVDSAAWLVDADVDLEPEKKFWEGQLSEKGKEVRSQTYLEEGEEGKIVGAGDFGLEKVISDVFTNIPSFMVSVGGGGVAAKGLIKGLEKMPKSLGGIGELMEAAKTSRRAARTFGLIEKVGMALGYGVTEGLMSAGMSGAEIEERVTESKHEDLMLFSSRYRDIYNAAEDESDPVKREEYAKGVLADEVGFDVAMKVGLFTAGTGAPAGFFLGPLGSKAAKAAISEQAQSAFKKSLLGNVAKDAVTEATQETIQSGGEQLYQNMGIRAYVDSRQGDWEGVAEAAVAGGITGGIMGGGYGAVQYKAEQIARDQKEAQEELRSHMEEVGEVFQGLKDSGASPSDYRSLMRWQLTDNISVPELLGAARELTETGTLPEKVAERMEGHFDTDGNLTEKALLQDYGQAKDQEFAEIDEPTPELLDRLYFEHGVSGYQTEGKLLVPVPDDTKEQTGLERLSASLDQAKVTYRIRKQRGQVSADASGRINVPEDATDVEAQMAVEAAGYSAATSPSNDFQEPTAGQIKAGNYRKGHIRLAGLNISIENPAGSIRKSKPGARKKWSRKLKKAYGYITGVQDGADGDKLDVFVGPQAHNSEREVYVVNQISPETGKFDEHKVMLGFKTEGAAKDAYLSEYTRGWKGLKSITPMSNAEFKSWIKEGDLSVSANPDEVVKVDESSRPAYAIKEEDTGLWDETELSSKEPSPYDELDIVSAPEAGLAPVSEPGDGGGSEQSPYLPFAPGGREASAAGGGAVLSGENVGDRTDGTPAQRKAAWRKSGTDSPFFKQWFDKSVIKDKAGKPRVLYRGSPRPEKHNIHDPAFGGRATGTPAGRLGVFFTTNKAQASKYGGSMRSAYMRMNNPYYMGIEEFGSFDTVEEAGARRQALLDDGHDGIIVNDPVLGDDQAYYISLRGKQDIKSAGEDQTGFFTESDDSRFSIDDKPDSKGMAQTKVQAFVNKLSKTWTHSATVVQSQEQLPSNVLEDLAAHHGPETRIEGVYDPLGDKMYLVADNLPDEATAQRVLFEEVLGHKGLRLTFGDDFNTFLDDAFALVGRPRLAQIVSAYGLDLDTVEGRREAMDEYLAKQSPQEAENTTLWEMLTSWVRRWWRSVYNNDMPYSNTEIRDLMEVVFERVKYGVMPQRSDIPNHSFKNEAGEFVRYSMHGGEKIKETDTIPDEPWDEDVAPVRIESDAINATYVDRVTTDGEHVMVVESLDEGLKPLIGLAASRGFDYLSIPSGEGSQDIETADGPTKAIDLRPEVSRFSLADPFYSQLNRVAEHKLPGKGTGKSFAQALNAFVRKGEIKQDELDWSGVIEYLDETDGKITKDQVMDFLRENEVKVEEVVLGGVKIQDGEVIEEAFNAMREQLARNNELDERAELALDAWAADPNERNAGSIRAVSEIEPDFFVDDAESSLRGTKEAMASTKFSDYQTPGGSDYRELLLTLPTKLPPRYEAFEYDDFTGVKMYGIRFPDGREVTGWKTREAAVASQSNQSDSPTYTGGHFDQPNVLAHIRFNTRTDADGAKVLFVEEVQSDWHQAGRKEGYQGQLSEETQRINDIGDIINEWAHPATRLNKLGVPNAPFKKTWPILAMKRAIRYAAENGYEKLAWTTGEMQADRYDLSKQVDVIHIHKAAAGVDGDTGVAYPDLYDVDFEKDGSSIDGGRAQLTLQQVEELIGKDLAKKADEQPAGGKNYTGLDLKVGGEGMKAFYDKMLPSAVNKYVKKWGARVTDTDVSISGGKPTDYADFHAYNTAQSEGATVPSIEITDSMKESVMQGQARFSIAPPTDSAEFKEWFGGSKVVDEDGSPKVVYHGTDNDIVGDGFKESMRGKNYSDKASKNAFFFSSSKEGAGQYGENIVPSFIKSTSLIEITDSMIEDYIDNWLSELESSDPVEHEHQVLTKEYQNTTGINKGFELAVVDLLVDQGVDAVKYVDEYGENTYAVRSSSNIKIIDDKSRFSIATTATQEDPRDAIVENTIRATPIKALSIREKWHRMREGISAMNWDDMSWHFKWSMIDEGAPIERLERQQFGRLLDAADSAYKIYGLSKNLPAVMQSVFKRGVPEFVDGIFKPVAGRKGLMEIFKPLLKDPKLLRKWEAYAVARRAKRLLGEGREQNLTASEIDQLLTYEQDHPFFGEVFDQWNDFNETLLQLAVDRGAMTQEMKDLWTAHDYVPFYRVVEDLEQGVEKTPGWQTKRGLDGQSVRSRRLNGADARVDKVFENMVLNSAKIVDSIYKNETMRRVVGLADGIAMKRIPMDQQAIRLPNDELIRALVKGGIAESWIPDQIKQSFPDRLKDERGYLRASVSYLEKNLSAEELEKYQTFFRAQVPAGPKIVSVMENGKPVFYEVEDPDLLRTIQGMGPSNFGAMVNLFLMKPKGILTSMVTSDPGFMAANYFRDLVASWVTAPAKGNFLAHFKDSIMSVKDIWEGDLGDELMMAGGMQVGYYSDYKDPNLVRGLTDQVNPGWNMRRLYHGWRKLGAVSEQSNRLAIAKNVLANGGSMAEAAWQAQDVLNFSQKGSNASAQFLFATVPFMNARIQGLYKMWRAARNDSLDGFRTSFMLKGMAIMSATLALVARNWDRDEYDALPEYTKDTYWNYFTDDGQHIKLPKPFEIGVLFATTIERTVRRMGGKETDRQTADAAFRAVLETFAFNPIPQTAKPLIEQWANRSMFTGRPIVNRNLRSLSPEAQYHPWTSETARTVGAFIGGLTPEGLKPVVPDFIISPVRIEAITRSFFGTMGFYVLQMSDNIARSAMDLPAAPAPDIDAGWVTPIVQGAARRFYGGDASNPRGNRYAGELYDVLDKANDLFRTQNAYIRQGRTDAAIQIQSQYGNHLLLRKRLNDVSTQLRDINTVSRLVRYSTVMTAEEKRDRLELLRARRNAVLTQVQPMLEWLH